MDLTQALVALVVVLITEVVSTIIAVKVSQSIMGEKLNNMNKSFDDHRSQSDGEITRLKYELSDLVKASQLNIAERLDITMDYITRVELNKADRSEVNLLIDATKRIEQKLDLLIRDTK
jgi:hypothetical protein